jgi:hypothetical protein
LFLIDLKEGFMSKQLKFLQVTTLLRGAVDPEATSQPRYEALLKADSSEMKELILNIQDLISGELVVRRETGQVSIGGQCFGPGQARV